MNERTIDLRDLFYKILYRWKLILVAMIIGGVIFGVYGYISVQKDREELVGDTDKNYLMDLTEEEVERVAYFIEYEKQYIVAKDNFENSVIQKLDISNIYTLDNVYTVVCDDKDRASMLVKAYEQCLESNEFYEKVAKVYGGIEAKDVKNLFTVKKDNDGTNNSKMTFAISFKTDDEKVCKAVNDVVKEYVEGLNEKFNETYGEGNVNLMSSQISSSGSSEILAKKMEELTNYETIKNKYFELKNGVSKEQIMIYKRNDATVSVKTYVIKVITGMILFAIVMSIIIIVNYVFNGKIKTADELIELYNIHVLGKIKLYKDDSFIKKLEYRKEKKLEKEKEENLISTKVMMVSKKNELNKIGVIKCSNNESLNVVCNELSLKLKENHMDTVVVDDILNKPEEMVKTSEVDGAVLVVMLNDTEYDDIKKELDVLKQQNVQIVGCIVAR